MPVLPCPPSTAIWKASPRPATLSVSSPITGCWQRPRLSCQGRTAVPGDGGETTALHLLQLPGGLLGPAPPDHRQGGIYPPGGQSALLGHQPEPKPPVCL